MDIGNISRDAFQRLRVSSSETLLDVQSQYDVQPLLWNIKKSAGGSETHLPNESSTLLAVTSANSEYIIKQSKEYLHYEPGKSHLIMVSGCFGNTPTGVVKRMGYFDTNNGIYLENNGGQISIVRRSYVSGAIVNTVVPMAQWNNRMNVGLSASVDPTKVQIFWIDLQWLGAGSVRCGLVIDGQYCLMHTFNHANLIGTVYMTSATLPVRYEITNVSSGVANNMRAIACTVQTENGAERIYGLNAAATNGATAIAVTTRRQVLAIRPAALFNSIVNRSQYDINQVYIRPTTNDCLVEVVYAPTSVASSSFAAVNAAYSAMEYDVAGIGVTGGTVIAAFPVGVNTIGVWNPVQAYSILGRAALCLDIDGSNPSVLSIVATSLSGTSNVSATLNWTEYR